MRAFMQRYVQGQLWIIAFLTMLPTSAVLAQTSGTILGNVHDTSGAVIVGATVTVTNVEQGTARSVVSNDSGDYTVPFLAPGDYRVTVLKPGFQPQQSPVTTLQVDQRARIDFNLNPGQVQQTVEVTTAPPLLRTDSPALGDVIGKAPVEDLPLNGRNFAQLVYLVPGVTQGQQGENLSGASTYNPRAGSSFNALGAQESTSAWLVDGIADNEFTFNTVLVQPSVESIQEFKVLTGAYSAEYGRGSGIVTTQTQAGSNAWHGQAAYFYRTAGLDARLYFNAIGTPKPPYIRHQWATTLGGPIKKDKLFFFMDYYGESQIQGVTFVNTVPTMGDRAGNFTDQLAAGNVIYDPLSTTVNAAGQTVRTPFSYNGQENVIPPNRINAIGSELANLYPLPTLPGLINNQTEAFNNTILDNGGVARVDYRASDKDSMFVRYSYERYVSFEAAGQSGCCIASTPAQRQEFNLGPFISGGQNTVLLANGLSYNETHIFNSSIVNQFIAGYSHSNPFTVNSDYGLNGAEGLGISGINISQATTGIPAFIAYEPQGLYTSINDGPAFLPANTRDTVYQLEDDLSWTKRSHQLSMGYRILKNFDSAYSNVATKGEFTFQNNLTNNPVNGQGGSGMASLLLGLTANNTSAGATRQFFNIMPIELNYEHSVYFQDDWKAMPNLTLNLGLRWDYFPSYYAKNNALTNFDSATNTLVYAGVNGISRSAGVQNEYSNLGPRIGFSYDAGGKTGLVVRGGYAISYTPQNINGSAELPNNLPWVISQNTPTLPLYPTAAQIAASEPNLANPFPTPTTKQPFTTAQLIADNPSITARSFINPTPSYQNWSLNIEKQFAQSYLLEIGYVGSRSVHLQYGQNLQEVQPGPSSIPAVDRETLPALPTLTKVEVYSPTNFANFQGATIELNKRLSHGVSFLTAYTWSKVLDDGGSAENGSGYVGNPQTITNVKAGYGPAGYNVPQRLVQSWLWDLPIGPGHLLLNGDNWFNRAVGGWEFDGIMTLQSGYAFTVGNMSSCPNGAANCWPNEISNPRVFPAGVHQTYAHWYNPAAFAVPCQIANTPTGACTEPAYAYGNVGRGTLRGPQTANFDLSMAKIFPVWEHLTAQARVDAFNAFNHPVLGVPQNGINAINSSNPAATSTAITTTEGDGRDLQGSVQLRW